MLLQLLTRFGYLAIFVLLVGGGVGVPVPEEILQLTAGSLAHLGYLSFVPTLLACYLGIVAGDFLLFMLARRHGELLLVKLRLVRLLTEKRRASLEKHFARHAFLTIVVARHTSGLRIPAYILAATHGVKPATFVTADALSAGLSVPLVVGAGWFFASQLEVVKGKLHDVQGVVLAVVVLLVAAWGFHQWWRRRPPRGPAAPPPGSPPAEPR